MGSLTSRQGDAGHVMGPFMAQVEQPGYPNRPLAAFIRPEDRDLFLLAVALKTAMKDRDQATAKSVLAKLRGAGVEAQDEPSVSVPIEEAAAKPPHYEVRQEKKRPTPRMEA